MTEMASQPVASLVAALATRSVNVSSSKLLSAVYVQPARLLELSHGDGGKTRIVVIDRGPQGYELFQEIATPSVDGDADIIDRIFY
jgi:hypothetical protein